MLNSDLKEEMLADLRKCDYEYNDLRCLVLHKAELLCEKKHKANSLLGKIEDFINKIANTPKEIQNALEEIQINCQSFDQEIKEIQNKSQNLETIQNSSYAAMAGGVSIATMAPTAAMAVATTFGTASTGTPIAVLHGAAATKAALAWLGGGALSAGGGGMAAGNALLSIAGPIGWTLAGGALLVSLYFVKSGNKKVAEQAKEHIKDLNAVISELTSKKTEIALLNKEVREFYQNMNNELIKLLQMHIIDFDILSEEDKYRLGAFVNNAKALAVLLTRKV